MAERDIEISPCLKALLPRLSARSGSNDWMPFRQPLFCRDCTVHFISSRTFRIPRLAVKVYDEQHKGRKKGKKLRFIHQRGIHFHKVATAHHAVPRPVLVMRHARALATEYIDAPMASSLLRGAFFSTSRKEEIIRKSAGWLGWFHAHADVATEPFVATRFIKRLASASKKIAAANPAAMDEKGFLGPCLAVAEKVALGMDGLQIPHASVHGDFTPFNLFIDGERVVGFDYQENGRLPVAHDICRFLLYLDFTRALPVAASELRQYGCRKRNFEVFMEAYGADPALLESDFWLPCHFMEVVRRITSLTLMQQRGRSRPLRHVEMASLKRSASHMMDSLK